MEIINNRKTINKYPDGYVVTIKDKNWIKIGNYKTPCLIHYLGIDYQLDNDFIIRFVNENQDTIRGEEMKRFLPSLLEYGEMIPFPEYKKIN